MSTSSRACASPLSESGRPGQQPRHLGDALVAVEAADAGCGHRAVAALHDRQVVGRERGHLREVRDDDDLRGLGEPREPAPDLDRGCAAHPGVDLVEDERGHRVAFPRSRPRSRASPATARRPRRPCRAAAARRRDAVAAGSRPGRGREAAYSSRAGDLDDHAGVGHGERGEFVGTRCSPSRSAAADRSSRSGPSASSLTSAASASTSARSSSMRSESPSSSRRRELPVSSVRDHVVERRAVLADERAELGAPLLDDLELARPVGVEGGQVAGELRRDVGDEVVRVRRRLRRPRRARGRARRRVRAGGARRPGGRAHPRRRTPRRTAVRARRRRRGAALRGWTGAPRARRARRPPPAAARRPRSRPWRRGGRRLRARDGPGRRRAPRVRCGCRASGGTPARRWRGPRRSGAPAKRSSASRWATADRRRIWSDCPCTTTSWLAEFGQDADRRAPAADDGA